MAFIEERWGPVVLSSFMAGPGGFSVAPGEVDWLAGTRRFMGAASDKANLGLRVALAFAMWAPLWMSFRFASLAGVPPEDRARFMERLLAHPIFFVRELTLLLKLVACLAIFRSSAARARTDYDRPDRAEPEPVESTGTRKKKLAVLPASTPAAAEVA